MEKRYEKNKKQKYTILTSFSFYDDGRYTKDYVQAQNCEMPIQLKSD